MNENAPAPHLLFGLITSLESLQRFKRHPIRASALEQIGGKTLGPGAAETKILLFSK